MFFRCQKASARPCASEKEAAHIQRRVSSPAEQVTGPFVSTPSLHRFQLGARACRQLDRLILLALQVQKGLYP